MDEKNSDEWLKNLPVQSENIGFQPQEMIRCAKCRRTNPPNRQNCFYCAAELEISEEQSKFLRPNLRKLESWEQGFNVVIKPLTINLDRIKIVEAARVLKVETEVLQKVIEAKKYLPIARAETEKEAAIAQNYLINFGIQSIVVSDENLNPEKPPRRLRGIEIFDDSLILILFNQDEIVEIPRENLALMVTGAIYERRIEATETRSKKDENKMLGATEIASDESLFDIYSREDMTGWRVSASGFDFSCLENEKGILAKDNIVKIGEKLRQYAPNAKIVDDYLRVRECLANFWEADQNTESHGIKRGGIGKFNLANVTTINNLSQFTRYSRLQRNLL